MSTTIQAVLDRTRPGPFEITRDEARCLCVALAARGRDGSTFIDDSQFGHCSWEVTPTDLAAAARATGLTEHAGIAAAFEAAVRLKRLLTIDTHDDSRHLSSDIQPTISMSWERSDEPWVQWASWRAKECLRTIGYRYTGHEALEIEAGVVHGKCQGLMALGEVTEDIRALARIAAYALTEAGPQARTLAS